MIVLVVWMLAMVAGLWWSRPWAAVCAAVAGAVFVGAQPEQLLHWTGWLQLGIVVGTPWLLAAQRIRDQQTLKALHATEAKQSTGLGEKARSLLSFQHASQDLETQIAQLSEVYHVTKQTSRALHVLELFSGMLETVPTLLNPGGLRLIDLVGPNPHTLRARRLPDGRMTAQEEHPETDPSGNDVERLILKTLTSLTPQTDGTAHELAIMVGAGKHQVAWAALWQEQKPIGVLIADDLPQTSLPMLSLIAKQLSLQLSRIHLYEQVEAMAVTDALTGLWVRRAFLERVAAELERSRRHSLACTLLMVDLDRFKEKNDTYGHLVGDVVLRDVAKLLHQNLREIDLIARYGGEEFIMLLVETSVEQAMPIAERLRQLVEVHPIRAYDELLNQTISMGVAGFPENAQTLEELIERADQALYAAKRSGRNRVMPWTTLVSEGS